MLIVKQPIGTIGIMAGVWAVPMDFTWSLAQMIMYNNEYLCGPNQYVHLSKPLTSYHSQARNELAQQMIGDWVLMLDSDHAFDPDLCARMVGLTKKWEVDVLTAVYRYKIPPYLPNLFRWNEATQGYQTIAKMDWTQPLHRIDCSGGGTLLVRRTVFERIQHELGEMPFEILPAPDGKRMYSEDFSFFTRLRRVGIQAYASPMIQSYHLVPHRISHADFQPEGVPMEEVR